MIKAKLQGYSDPEVMTSEDEMAAVFETIDEQYDRRFRVDE